MELFTALILDLSTVNRAPAVAAVWGVLFGAVKRSFASESIIAQSVNAVNRQFD
jgi:hypothetical protein